MALPQTDLVYYLEVILEDLCIPSDYTPDGPVLGLLIVIYVLLTSELDYSNTALKSIQKFQMVQNAEVLI